MRPFRGQPLFYNRLEELSSNTVATHKRLFYNMLHVLAHKSLFFNALCAIYITCYFIMSYQCVPCQSRKIDTQNRTLTRKMADRRLWKISLSSIAGVSSGCQFCLKRPIYGKKIFCPFYHGLSDAERSHEI